MNRSKPKPRLERVHILPSPRGLGEASRFIVNSLLLSHGIRSDSTAIVRVGDTWIVAPGSSVRHLRPDADSAEGWLRAVLRGRPLGAFRLSNLELDTENASPTCIYCNLRETLGLGVLEEAYNKASGRLLIVYLHGPDERMHLGWLRDLVCGYVPLPPHTAAAVVNVVLDRILAGLEPIIAGGGARLKE